MDKVRTKKHKYLGLFSVIRGYNVVLLSIAQYLAAIFVFAVDNSLKEVLLDMHLHFVVFATVFVVSAGYIINDFYDSSLDIINKPLKTYIGSWISKKTKLQIYFVFNFIAFVFSFLISWRAALFFAFYIFLIWFYSHKLQKRPIIRILSISILDVLPFFIVFVYYNHVSEIILMHGLFLYGLILAKEIIKSFKRTKGAILNNRETLVTKYGEFKIKTSFVCVLIAMVFTALYLLDLKEIGDMRYFFYCFLLFVPFIIYLLAKATKTKDYLWIHNFLKAILVIGVFSLMLIDTSVLLIRLLNQVSLL